MKKWVQLDIEPRKTLLLGKVENNKYPEVETWHQESIDRWSYYRLFGNF